MEACAVHTFDHAMIELHRLHRFFGDDAGGR